MAAGVSGAELRESITAARTSLSVLHQDKTTETEEGLHPSGSGLKRGSVQLTNSLPITFPVFSRVKIVIDTVVFFINLGQKKMG